MWRHLLERLRDLSAAGRASAYERAKLCASLLENEGYIDDCAARRRQPADELNELTNDLALDAGALCQIVKVFPDETSWEVTPLRVLYSETVANIRREQSVRSQWDQSKARRTKAQHAIDRAEGEENRRLEQQIAWEDANRMRSAIGCPVDEESDDDTALEESIESLDLVASFDRAAPSEKLRLLRSREFLSWLQERRGVSVVDDALAMMADDDDVEFESYLSHAH